MLPGHFARDASYLIVAAALTTIICLSCHAIFSAIAPGHSLSALRGLTGLAWMISLAYGATLCFVPYRMAKALVASDGDRSRLAFAVVRYALAAQTPLVFALWPYGLGLVLPATDLLAGILEGALLLMPSCIILAATDSLMNG